MTDIMEARRKGFEEWANSVSLYTGRDSTVGSYISQDTDDAWYCWNAALDSVCVELPGRNPEYIGDRDHQQWACGCNYGINSCREAIERYGLKVKP